MQAMLTDAEVHGLVDGRLDGDKRAEILRRLATSPLDRQRVESWQEQNELIRGAFASVEKEPLPITLNLTAPQLVAPNFQAVAAGDPPMALPQGLRSRNLAGLAAVLIVLFGLGGLWLMLDPTGREEPTTGFGLRSSIDDTLADRADAALDKEGSAAPIAIAAAEPDMPTTQIPDLSAAGFAFASAEASEPAALLFHYRNAAAERLVVGVARATRSSQSREPIQSGRTLGWRRGARAYAIAGTMAPEQLRMIATLLQDGAATRH